MDFVRKTIFSLVIIIFMNTIWCICDEGYTEYDGKCYYDEDLHFLTLLIYMNKIEFELHYEIGLTIWQNGRINTLLAEGMAIHCPAPTNWTSLRVSIVS
jgi:hypothetical protein